MKLSPVIEALRRGCPFFENRVNGTLTLKPLSETTATSVPSAYVVLLDDDPGIQAMQTGYYQNLMDRFAVIVHMDNAGQTGSDQIHEMRASLLRILAGASLDQNYDPIIYCGGTVLETDGSRISYQFTFSATTIIRDEETAHGIFLAALPSFEGIAPKLDPR